MVNFLAFSVCFFGPVKNDVYKSVVLFISILYLQKFCLIKKWMMLEIADKNVSETMAMPNNLVLACRF